MHGELKLEKDLAELSIPELLARLNELSSTDHTHDHNEDGNQEGAENIDENMGEESDSEDEEPIDEGDVSSLHQFYTRRCARLQEVRDQVEPLRRALRDFEKGYVASRRTVDDTVDTDERDENYRPDPRQLRQITVPTPLWQRQPEVAALHRRRVQRIRRLEGRIRRVSSEVREARSRWTAARDALQRVEQAEQLLKERRSREQKRQERRWVEDFQRAARERRKVEEQERAAAAQRQREKEEAEQELECRRDVESKRKAIAQHVEKFLERERLKRERTENGSSIQYYRNALAKSGKETLPSKGKNRPELSLQSLQVMLVICQKRDTEIAAMLAKLDPPPHERYPNHPSVQKYARDNHSIEEGDLEFHYSGPPGID